MTFESTINNSIRSEIKSNNIEDISLPKYKKSIDDDSITDIATHFYHELEISCMGKHRKYKDIDAIIVDTDEPILFYVLAGKLNSADFFRAPHTILVPMRKANKETEEIEIVRFEKLPHLFL